MRLVRGTTCVTTHGSARGFVRGSTSGFTLVELITVIVILGVISIGVSTFLSSGVQIFVDASERDSVVSEGRFAIERVSRDVRQSLPNSLRVIGDTNGHCLEFVPVHWSSYYFDAPVAPEPANNQVEAVVWDSTDNSYSFQAGDQVVIYATTTEHIYTTSGRRFPLINQPTVADDVATLSFASAVNFATDSPNSRVYITSTPVSYCVRNGQLTRHENYGFLTTQSASVGIIGAGVPIATDVANSLSAIPGSNASDPFVFLPATLTRNSALIFLLLLDRNEETLAFSHEVHLTNVP